MCICISEFSIELDDAKNIIKAATDAIENPEIANEPEEEAEIVSASAVPSTRMGMIKESGAEQTEEDGGDKFSDAERRLREELAAFKIK